MTHEVFIDDQKYVPEQQAPPEDSDWLSQNFRKTEFACNHCGDLGPNGIDQELLNVLEMLRTHFGNTPVTITSGYRCQTHNTNVGSTESSQHRKGTAADIQVKDVAPNTVHAYLVGKYPNQYGIGRYSSFTHIDVRANKARW